MRILVVDSNRVFARKVGDFLEQHLKKVEVDYATNVPILRRRLRVNDYDYIIADIFTAFDAKAMQEVLSDVDTPMLVWSILKSPDRITNVFRDQLAKRVLPKPDDDAGIEAAVTSVMLQTVE